MAGSSQHAPSDPLRKALIVAVLVGALLLLYRYAIPTGELDPTGMLALGFVILAGYTIGQLAEVMKLPHITGYLVGGLLMGSSVAHSLPEAWQVGPFAEGILNPDVLDQLGLFNTLALALIALTAGGELKLQALRRDLGPIAGVLGGQTIAVAAVSFGLMWAISSVPALAMDPFTGLGLGATLAFGALLAPVSLATSPAATIAVINGSQAEGPMTRTVLSTVVLKDVVVVVLFSISGAVAGQVLGQVAIEGSLGTYLMIHVVGSLVIGAVIGVGMALYLRFVNTEVLLFLVGLIYTAALIAQHLFLDPLLLFMAAGFVTSNFSREGDSLIHNVERLSMPVYVVFFTLAGATLHLDSLAEMAPYALALVGVRALALYAGSGVGAAVAGADAATRRHGWLGFVSQAGVAISLATLISETYGPSGEALGTLIIASLALNELIGPVMLKLGLGLAGELPRDEAEPDEAPASSRPEADRPTEGLPFETPEHLDDPWGEPPATRSTRLNALATELEGELQALVRDLLQGPLASFSSGASAYLRSLRREFLRHHRRAVVQVQSDDERTGITESLRLQQAEMAERWRGLVLDRAARLRQEHWNPLRLVEAVDALVEGLPETVEAPWEETSFESGPDESPWIAVQRGVLRLRHRWSRMLGGQIQPRQVQVQALGRYHLSGKVPGRLEPFAALLIASEIHLANRTRSLFDGLVVAYDRLADLSRGGVDADDEIDATRIEEALERVRSQITEEFSLASREIDQIVRQAALRVASALGEALRGFKRDLPEFGTLDLPDRRRRYSRVYSQRTAAVEMLTEDFFSARGGDAAQFSVLGLELELVGLEGRIKYALESHADQMARMVRGRGPVQLDRVRTALDETLGKLEELLASERPGDAMADRIRELAEPVGRIVSEALRSARQLQDYLADEEGIAPLLDELIREASRLTDRYVIPTSRMTVGEQSLPDPPDTVEVPIRELTLAYIESSVSRNLLDLSSTLSERVERLKHTLEELERVVAFNVELAGGELDVLGDETVPEETLGICREMLVGALGRTRSRLLELETDAEAWPAEARAGVRDAVLGDLESFRTQMVDGRVTELRLRLLRERATTGRLAREAGQLTGGLRDLGRHLEELATTAIGTDRLDQVRLFLGIPTSEQAAAPRPETFAPPGDPERLPVVYRRLFSDQALEAGDLLTGRQEEIGRARRVLSGREDSHRAVAVIGMDGAGKGAVINAVVRAIDVSRVIRLDLKQPAELDDVEGWFQELQGGELFVVEGLQWLFRMRPGGFAPLRRFIEGMVERAGDTAFLASASTPVWRYASLAAPLEDALPELIHLKPLDASALQAAVLTRHSMSGYRLRFEAQDDLAWQLQHLLTRTSDQSERQQQAWFHTLHQATGGVIHDALNYWMASINRIDTAEGVVHVGPVPRPPMSALRQLPDDELLTLAQALRQGWITADLHADLFRVAPTDASAHLARLTWLGLLEPYDGRYRLARHLLTPVYRVLEQRGWTP